MHRTTPYYHLSLVIHPPASSLGVNCMPSEPRLICIKVYKLVNSFLSYNVLYFGSELIQFRKTNNNTKNTETFSTFFALSERLLESIVFHVSRHKLPQRGPKTFPKYKIIPLANLCGFQMKVFSQFIPKQRVKRKCYYIFLP